MNTPENYSIKDGEFSLVELILKINQWLKYLLSKWVIIFCTAILGATIGLFIAFTDKPIYTAELTFALQGEQSGRGIGGALGIASQFGLDLGSSGGGDEFSGDNLIELLKSRSMVERALLAPVTINGKTETLAELYISFNKLRESWKNKPTLKNMGFPPNSDRSKFTLQQDSVLGGFYKSIIISNLSVSKIEKKLSIISLKVNSQNELFSKYFAQILETVVSDFYIQTKTKKTLNNVNILQHQTDSVRASLYYAIGGVASSIDANPNPNPLMQTLRVSSQRKQIDVTAGTAILSELLKNLEIAKMSLLQETPLIQIIDVPILPLEKEKLGKLKSLVIGGFIAGFLMCAFLILKKTFINLFKNAVKK